MTLQPLLMNFLIYEENFILFFISVPLAPLYNLEKVWRIPKKIISATNQSQTKKTEFQVYVTAFAWHV
jgi:hypothetical protein